MDKFRVAFEELAEEYARQAEQLREMYAKLGELTATAQSNDHMVTVTVGLNGQIRSIEFDPRVYRKLSPSELSQSIIEQIGLAVGEVSERTRELMEPFAPEGLPYDELFGEQASFESFLPANLPSEERR
ncbi:YbaB/EbfC family nucleoid-associated protein [Streptosporangium sp. CA-115845]|uniref:YbaB/EbfC family nucleoid-associated protein n=1 Tax=Streptosporangium sp. CA-115845 TaxID=3240071 RepID=UPI003D8BEE03